MNEDKTYNEDLHHSEGIGSSVKHIEDGAETAKVQSLTYDVSVQQNFGQVEKFTVYFEVKCLFLEILKVQKQMLNLFKLVFKRHRLHSKLQK
jgi:hypothetical protein